MTVCRTARGNTEITSMEPGVVIQRRWRPRASGETGNLS